MTVQRDDYVITSRQLMTDIATILPQGTEVRIVRPWPWPRGSDSYIAVTPTGISLRLSSKDFTKK